jgi:transposase
MEYYAGIDVSLESASLCVVDATGRIVREAKVASEPDVLIGWFRGLEFTVTRIGLEAGPLSQWLYAGMREAGLPVELLETRHGPECIQGNAGQDRSERRAWHRPADAARLVPVSALQIVTGAGSASAANGAEAAADQEP